MKTRTKIVLSVAGLSLFLVVAALVPWFDPSPRIREALGKADRIICRDPLAQVYAHKGYVDPGREITDRAAIDALSETMHCSRTSWFQRTVCACRGWPLVEVYRGNELLLRFSLHHQQSVRIEGECNGPLTSEARVALRQWLQANGFPDDEEILRLRKGATPAQ